ncbi:hypothetical protein S83_022207 [Arachis hypogaea]
MEEGEEGGDDRDGRREGCQIDREKKRNEATAVMDATAAVGSVELCPFTYQSAFLQSYPFEKWCQALEGIN